MRGFSAGKFAGKFSVGKFLAGVFSVWAGSIFALAVAISPARADDIPTLHVEQVCHGIVNQSGDSLTAGDPKVQFQQCMDAEKADRDALAKEWSTFTADDKRHCTDESRMGGDSSYTELITCLEMARDVRSLRAGNGLTPGAGQHKP